MAAVGVAAGAIQDDRPFVTVDASSRPTPGEFPHRRIADPIAMVEPGSHAIARGAARITAHRDQLAARMILAESVFATWVRARSHSWVNLRAMAKP